MDTSPDSRHMPHIQDLLMSFEGSNGFETNNVHGFTHELTLSVNHEKEISYHLHLIEYQVWNKKLSMD